MKGIDENTLTAVISAIIAFFILAVVSQVVSCAKLETYNHCASSLDLYEHSQHADCLRE